MWLDPPQYSSDADATAHGQSKLSFGDDSFPLLQALFDHDLSIDMHSGDDRTRLDRLIGLYHENKRSVLSGLHRLARDDQSARFHSQSKNDSDKLPRPKLMIPIRVRCLDKDRPGPCIYRIIDKK